MTTAGEAKNGRVPLEEQKMGNGSSSTTSPVSIATASTAAAATKETVVTAKVSNGTVTNVTIVQTSSDAAMQLSPIIPPAAVSSATAEPQLVNMEGSSSVCSICRHESDNEEEETLLDCTAAGEEDDVVKNVSTQTPMPTTPTALAADRHAVVISMV